MLHAFLLAAAAQLPCDRDPAPIKMAQPVLPPGFHVPGNATGTATVAVTLDDAGKVTAVSIYKSSGNGVMDAAALEAARRSTFAPGAENCTPVGGTFAADFLFGAPEPAKPPCFRDVTVQNGVTPAYPASAAAAGIGETQVTVRVDVASDGSVRSSRIYKSSGNRALDDAALAAAAKSTYLPKIVNCKTVDGTYDYIVTFDPR
jgi:TonB family protein